MGVLISHWGTSATREGEGRIRFENRGTLVTVLLWGGVVFTGAGTVANAVLAARAATPLMFAGALMALLLFAVLAGALVTRRRQMGVFVLDREAGTFEHVGRGSRPLADVESLETQIDPFERNPTALVRGQARWLVARLRGGGKVRLCKGHPPDLEPVLALLRAWGLPLKA